jgi:subtilisin family serine protease
MRTFLFILFIASFLPVSAQLTILGDINGPLHAIKPASFLNANYTGKGVNIGVIDVGFEKLGINPGMNHIIRDSRLMFARNYLHRALNATDSTTKSLLSLVPVKDLPGFTLPLPDLSPLADTTTLFTMGNTHGALVSYLIAGIPGEESLYGMGKDANYFLAKTEFGKKDHRLEEFLLGKALQDFYERKVKLVNISLGYRSNFELSEDKYTREMLDGKTALSSRLCNEYAGKGMIIVVAAGNEGFKSWKAISAPGDADDVITVGSTRDTNSILKAWFSSIGEGDLLKPDVVCFSMTGTSLSAPVIAGLVAAMLQKDSSLTPKQVKNLLHRASTLYPFPNNYVGYGVPDASKIWKLMNGDSLPATATEVKVEGKDLFIEIKAKRVDCFHKTDAFHVSKQEVLNPNDGVVYLERPKGVRFTTLVPDMNQVIEIEWQ